MFRQIVGSIFIVLIWVVFSSIGLVGRVAEELVDIIVYCQRPITEIYEKLNQWRKGND